MPGRGDGESRDGVPLTNLDKPLFDGANRTKRDLVEYLDGARDGIIPVLRGPAAVGDPGPPRQEAFMQKNVPKYTPSWVPTIKFWAETSNREVSYALCNDRRTLLWFANQRAVEYHPTLVRAERLLQHQRLQGVQDVLVVGRPVVRVARGLRPLDRGPESTRPLAREMRPAWIKAGDNASASACQGSSNRRGSGRLKVALP